MIIVNLVVCCLVVELEIWNKSCFGLRARLHQTSASTLQQHCDDACDTVLIEINGIA